MASELYDSFIADYYDESPGRERAVQDVAFLSRRVRESRSVLERVAGHGAHNDTLSEAGKRLTGLDLSSH